jgi:DNA-binding CsgD family transcriptional regulator
MLVFDADQFDKACSRLGEAVLEPAKWPEITEDLCVGIGALGGLIIQLGDRTPDIPRTASVDEAISWYFRNDWHKRDIRARSAPLFLRGQMVVTDEDIVTREETQTSPYFNEFFYPHGLGWWSAVGFMAGSDLWALSLLRTARMGPFEEAYKRLLAPLSQRLAEVSSLSKAVGHISLRSVTNALNAFGEPAVAIDRSGFILDANRAAEMLFDADIRIRDRRLVVSDAAAKHRLEQLVDRLLVTSDLAPFPCDPIVIQRRKNGPVILRVLPIHGAARNPFLGARAVLTLMAAAHRERPKAALFAAVFGLTPAEARLASIIAKGHDPARAAEELGIARVTARNQLRAIFAKTGTHRQSELVALLSLL